MADASSSSSTKLHPSGFNTYNTQLQSAALKATKCAVGIPSDLAFHRSIDRGFARDIDACSGRVLALTNRLLALASTADASADARRKGKAKLESTDDVVDNFHSLVIDSMDQLLERADICLDEYLGRSKPPAITVNSVQPTVQKTKRPNVPQGKLDPALQHASHIPKPQLRFKRKVDNSRHTIWRPTLAHKYNAQVPLGYSFGEEEGEGEDDSEITSLHPYRYEIKHIPYPSRMFSLSSPVKPRSFDETPFTWVETSESFNAMLDMLRGASEIAVDLEYHSYRTFGGFVCLMQLSTRDADWVVDTLAVREDMEALNEVFTDPKIVKVLHGADSDVVWLQQDFNLYVVNLFDTYHASKVLEFPRHNLATLLEMYCDFTADKRYQLADWRIRPLPQEMLHYARSDTHFLLYIYDNLRNALIDRAQSRSRSQSRAQSPSGFARPPGAATPSAPQNFIRTVLSRSEETALRVYTKESYNEESGSGPGGWDTLARKWNKGALVKEAGEPEGTGVQALQRRVYRCVHAWRDAVAREEDESTRYVLPNHYIFILAERPPADMAALLSVFHPVPPVIRRRTKELLDAIRDTVKAQLGNTGAANVTEQQQQASEVSPETVKTMQVNEAASNAVISSSSTSLWAKVLPPSAAALSSSLFGNTSNAIYKAEVSDLPPLRNNAMTESHFREVVARIHGALVIAPSALKLPITPQVDEESAVAEVEETSEMAVEIPFIPVSQRQPQPLREVLDHSIVVVGQSRTKKRKRDRGASGKEGEGAETPSANEEGKASAEGTPFDYNAVSNILDDASDLEPEEQGARKKKHRQGKGAAGHQYGNFPAPPKAHSQLKSGNQSRTFG
ncbi:Exosome complex exonuclease rrp6 [Sparassis crispa]|uniref:Exosome complex exonuclease rrp6 n=1 Tax=Sparassis crispa TaxID=139825 RepID=A0A401GSS8_9APHY|nr:Exosome complex exonuclease rrp6 [Sparassis crispa]GBE85266.1 Exosome complex exonuclease rrp6 [Sparassis crispa]